MLRADVLYGVFGDSDFYGIADPQLRPLLFYGAALLAVAIVRYADRGAAATGFAAGLLVFANLALPLALGRAMLPFLLMLTATGAGVAVHRLAKRPDYFYYRTCLQTVKVLALAAFYLEPVKN